MRIASSTDCDCRLFAQHRYAHDRRHLVELSTRIISVSHVAVVTPTATKTSREPIALLLVLLASAVLAMGARARTSRTRCRPIG